MNLEFLKKIPLPFKMNSWKGLLFNIVLMMLLSFGIIYYFFEVYLPSATHYGEVIIVPDFNNMSVEDAQNLAEEKELRINEKIDTTWSASHEPYHIVTQHPEPGSEVKSNRRIYLTINSGAVPMVTITESIYDKVWRKSYSQSRSVLGDQLGFNITPIEVISQYDGLALDIKYDGKSIESGLSIPQGSTIIIQVGVRPRHSTDDNTPEPLNDTDDINTM